MGEMEGGREGESESESERERTLEYLSEDFWFLVTKKGNQINKSIF